MRARSSAVLAAATTCFEPDGHQARAGGGSDGAGTDCFASIKADLSCRCQHLSKAKTPHAEAGDARSRRSLTGCPRTFVATQRLRPSGTYCELVIVWRPQ